MLTDEAMAALVGTTRDSPLRRVSRLTAPPLAVRVAARLRRCRLDHALSQGSDPAGSPLLAARAAQLSREGNRRRIAEALERMALSADQHPACAQIVPSRTAVLFNRADLLQIAALLRDDRRLYTRGMAILTVFVTDGTGPAYADRHGEVIAGQLQLARASLTG